MRQQHMKIEYDLERPEYVRNSGILLEVRFSGEKFWHKLADAQVYNRNRAISVKNQIEEMSSIQQKWQSNGPKKYFNAEYRIGQYKLIGRMYAWVPAHILLEEVSKD